MDRDEQKEAKSPYHLDLEPGQDGHRPEWNLIIVSDTKIGVDFYHTDMLEKVITIRVKKELGNENDRNGKEGIN